MWRRCFVRGYRIRIEAQDKLRQRHARLTELLDTLYTLFHSLRLERTGAMDFDSIETRILWKTEDQRLCWWCEMMHIV